MNLLTSATHLQWRRNVLAQAVRGPRLGFLPDNVTVWELGVRKDVLSSELSSGDVIQLSKYLRRFSHGISDTLRTRWIQTSIRYVSCSWEAYCGDGDYTSTKMQHDFNARLKGFLSERKCDLDIKWICSVFRRGKKIPQAKIHIGKQSNLLSVVIYIFQVG